MSPLKESFGSFWRLKHLSLAAISALESSLWLPQTRQMKHKATATLADARGKEKYLAGWPLCHGQAKGTVMPMCILQGQSQGATSCIYIMVPQFTTKLSPFVVYTSYSQLSFQKGSKIKQMQKFALLQSFAHSPVTVFLWHFQLFHVSLILWTPSEVYRSQLLHSADRNLACLWSDLVFQITWILRTVSCSTFTFSAQVFQSVLFPSREGPGHPSAQQHQGHCPGSSGCRVCPVCWENLLQYVQTFAIPPLPHKPDTSGGRGRGVSWGLSYICHKDSFLKKE